MRISTAIVGHMRYEQEHDREMPLFVRQSMTMHNFWGLAAVILMQQASDVLAASWDFDAEINHRLRTVRVTCRGRSPLFV